jgi:hypothetical protein
MNLLEKCYHLSLNPLEDSLLFGKQLFTDSDTGITYERDGYSVDKNQELLIYIEKLSSTYNFLYTCLNDLSFFEKLLSVENIPLLDLPSDNVRFLNLNFQHWLIKSITCFDCVLHIINVLLELGLSPKSVNSLTVVENENVRKNGSISTRLKTLDEILSRTKRRFSRKNKNDTFKSVRNKIIHYNEFEHQQLSVFESDASLMELNVLEIDNIDFQSYLADTSMNIKDELKIVNHEILKEAFNLFKSFDVEYRNRFNQKLVE